MKHDKQKILVIINPISGTNNKTKMPELVNKILNHDIYDVTTQFTQRPGHATEMAKEAIAQNFHGVVAIGGDGTINEIASAIINTDVALGIIPTGSGNGLARHIGIPMSPEKALEIINENNIANLDYCTVNDIPFFCTCGVGFDALVSEKFSHEKQRGPISYAKNALIEYQNYECEEYTLKTQTGILIKKAFVIACGNASQYGNNAYIAPKASMQDGLIDVTLIQPFNRIETPIISLQLFLKQLYNNANIISFRSDELTISRSKEAIMHIDGEPIMMPADLLIKCHPAGFKAFIPTKTQSSPFKPIEIDIQEFINTIRDEIKQKTRFINHNLIEPTQQA